MSSPSEKREAAERLLQVADLEEEAEAARSEVEESLDVKLANFFSGTTVMDEHEAITKLSNYLNINASQARKHVQGFPTEYMIQDHSIPDIIKVMRKQRRKLKGDSRLKMSKAIDTLIDGYSDHLDKCIQSIYWLKPYNEPLRKMRFNETDLRQLHSIKGKQERREIIDTLCKYWEAELEQSSLSYGTEFASLQKNMNTAKRAFRQHLKETSKVRKSIKDETNDFILKSICDVPGIGARQIFDRMPDKLHNRCSANMVSKLVKSLDITEVEGSYYKLNDDIKKNIYAYTAAFIDSDGYITVDRNMNPRVGLVATGERGKAFMIEIQKALGIGRLHLDQKSPQNTRPVNRLNFYSQAEVTELLTKCRPHFRMKGKNADLLIELIRMKKSYKKAEWYKGRCQEIFKLMKYENHKDHVGYDFVKDNIDIETVAKLHDNCKIDLMDSLENISTPLLKEALLKIPQIELEEEDPCCLHFKEEFLLHIGMYYQDYEKTYPEENIEVVLNEASAELENLVHMECNEFQQYVEELLHSGADSIWDKHHHYEKIEGFKPFKTILQKLLKDLDNCVEGI